MRNKFLFVLTMFAFLTSSAFTFNKGKLTIDKTQREEKRKQELDQMQKEFEWWPTDAKPAPVKDPEQGGYWWWPDAPGQARPWGNRGYIYVYRIIYDYKAEDKYEEEVAQPVEPTPTPAAPELKPSLLVKKILKNVKIYFDYNKADIRPDHTAILEKAIKTLQHNPQASILITGNCDTRGSVEYNQKLGKKRGEVIKEYMLSHGIAEDRVKIISRGKLDAVASITDLVGMQKDRNAQFMVAEVEEVMIPNFEQEQGEDAKAATKVEEGKYLIEKEEKVDSAVQVSTKEYVIQKNDSLWKIAKNELGSGHRWKYLYEFNKERIKNPNKLKAGTKILIPVE